MHLDTLIPLLAHEDFFIRNTALQISDKQNRFTLEATQKITQTIDLYGLEESNYKESAPIHPFGIPRHQHPCNDPNPK